MVCNECYNTLNRTAGNCECVCLYKYIEVGRTGLFRCKFTCARRARTFSGLFGRVRLAKQCHTCVCALYLAHPLSFLLMFALRSVS